MNKIEEQMESFALFVGSFLLFLVMALTIPLWIAPFLVYKVIKRFGL